MLNEELDLMRGAEDSVSASEHHFSEYGFCASPALTLAVVAPMTKKMRLGTGSRCCPSTIRCGLPKKSRFWT